ncbi:MAG: hypothetical protein WCG28_03615 [bacterium]
MEKQKFGVESGSSKVLKLLALVLGMGAAEQAMAQVPMEQLVKEAKVIEMQLSENAAKKGKQLLVNGVPAVAIDNDSSKLQVRYLDNERTKPISFLIYKNKKYFWDSDADGKIDGIYVDKNENEGKMPSEEEYMKVKLTIMSGGPSQTELDLGDMMNKGKGNKYIYFRKNEVRN